MRKLQNIAFAGAIALAGTALTACSSDSDVVADNTPVNPTYDGQSVKTKFAINIAAPGKTRMGEDATQSQTSPVFLGMNGIVLFPGTAAGADGQALNNAAISLDEIANTGDSKLVQGAASQYVYNDVNIPVGTSNFLFYGASKGVTSGTPAQNGVLTTSLATPANILSTSDIDFTLSAVLADVSGYDTKKTAMAKILTDIAGVNGWSTEATDGILIQAYRDFTNTADLVRGGSSAAILRTVQDLYNTIKGKVDASNTVALAIKTQIEASFTIAADGKLSWTSSDNANFPAGFGLPEGAVQLQCTAGTFSYKDTPNVGTGDNRLSVYGLTYPAALYYFANTPAIANNSDTPTWPTSTSGWETGFAGWDNSVLATSRSIALKNNINYGVAKLETTVKCATNLLEDNAQAKAGAAANNKISVPAGGFKVTAVLVGGQPDAVNWQFVNESTTATDRDAVVYDTDLTNISATTTASAVNYTLLLDNWSTASTGQDKVNIAIELENGGQDFYGVDGLIGAGQKFYLVAQLDPAKAGLNTITFPDASKCVYPHTGTTRVFMQDFTTKANLNIKSLKNAYVTIPDLRSSKLQLGLSVDLSWQSGLVFNEDIE